MTEDKIHDGTGFVRPDPCGVKNSGSTPLSKWTVYSKHSTIVELGSSDPNHSGDFQ